MNQVSVVKDHAGLIVVCLLFLTTGILRLNDLSLYTPDSSRYLIWGNSLAHGQGFVDNTLPDPDPYVVHAPLYPILIAPVEFFAPYSVVAVKAWTLLWGLVAVALVYFWLNQIMGKKGALVGAILFAANPLFWIYSTEVLSDALFIAVLLGVMYLIEKFHPFGEESKKHFMLLVVLVVFAAMVREVGLTLVLAIVLYLLSMKQIKRAAFILFASGIFIAVWYMRNNAYAHASAEYSVGNFSLVFTRSITGSEVSIMNEFALRMWITFRSYASQLGELMFSPMYSNYFGHLFFTPSSFYTSIEHALQSVSIAIDLCVGLLILVGCVVDLSSGRNAMLRIVFLALYLAAILLYPINDIRFLVAILPMMILYVVVGARWVMRKIHALAPLRRQQYALAIVLVFMVPNIVSAFEMLKANYRYTVSPDEVRSSGDESAMYTSLYARPWSTLGKWIRDHIEEHTIMISPYKQLSTVVGDRKVLTIDKGITLPQFESTIREFGIQYVIAPRRWGDIKVYEASMMESKRFRFEQVYNVGDLFVYHIHERLRESMHDEAGMVDHDTLNANASTLLRNGWRELSKGKYESANQIFLNALALAPAQPEVVYYTLISYALLDDSIHAKEFYQRLYGVPQAGSYLDPAKNYLAAMNQTAAARELNYSDGVAVQSLKAASMYWKLGAFWKAAQLMNYSLKINSGYFVGLLWGFHFNLQVGDTATALSYLSILDSMDTTNPVVVTFRHTISLADSINNAKTPTERSDHHLTIAVLYKKIELYDEALDEAEVSLRENPHNSQTIGLIAELLERRSRPHVVLDAYRQVLVLDPDNQTARMRVDSLQQQRARRGW